MPKRQVDVPEQWPSCKIFTHAYDAGEHAMHLSDRNTNFIVIEYPKKWGNHAAIQKTRRGVQIQVKEY